MTPARELFERLESATSLGIVCHNNPDPDALASALALERIADAAGIGDVGLLYGGTISHQQNRAFVNLFEIDLVAYTPADLDGYDLIAFVDHSVPGSNNDVPPGTAVDVVIDHHPAEEIEAGFVDHREEVGATATILAEYLRELDLDLDEEIATALLFAIRRETLGLLRGVTPAEYEAAAYLHPEIDTSLLRRLADPPLTPATVDTVSDAIDNRVVRGACLVSHVGRTGERDALPQAADYLANLEGIETAVVSGVVEGTIQLSGRSTASGVHAGDLLAEAFRDVGSAGGHADMAGGRIPLGLFADWERDEEAMRTLVGGLIANRVFGALNLDERGGGDDGEP